MTNPLMKELSEWTPRPRTGNYAHARVIRDRLPRSLRKIDSTTLIDAWRHDGGKELILAQQNHIFGRGHISTVIFWLTVTVVGEILVYLFWYRSSPVAALVAVMVLSAPLAVAVALYRDRHFAMVSDIMALDEAILR